MKTLLFYTFIFVVFGACDNVVSDTEAKSIAPKVVNDSLNIIGKQQSKPEDEDVKEAYCKAIAEYIKAVYKKDRPLPDTLFIGKHPDFPDIDLPATIEGANILLLTSEDAQLKLAYRKSLIFLNVMGWLEADKAEFS